MARFGDLGTQYFDSNGDPLAAGLIYMFETGTTTPLTTYSDSGLTTPNAHPVVLAADGRQPDIFFNGSAKGEIRTALGVSVEIRDPVGEGAGASAPWDEWVSTVTYDLQAVVTGSNGEFYVSISASNLGNDPVSDAVNWTLFQIVRSWNTNETYAVNQHVFGTDGFLYVSQQATNLAQDPVADFTGTWWLPSSLLVGYTHNNVTFTNIVVGSGAINGTTVGAITPSTGAFTTITASSTLVVTGQTTLNGHVILGSNASDNITFNGDIVGHMTPNANASYSLGTDALEWLDIWIDGIAYIDTLNVHVAADFIGTATFNDNVILGATNADTITFNGDTVGHLTPSVDNTDDLGEASFQYKDIYINGVGYIDEIAAGAIIQTPTINTPTVDDSAFTGFMREGEYSLTGTILDAANNTIQYKTLGVNTTFTENLSNGDSITLHLSGGLTYTVTWPTMTWIGTSGVDPTLTAADVFVIWQKNGTVYGAYPGSES
jgi:hypothetical protein